jgi:hypothetical protein
MHGYVCLLGTLFYRPLNRGRGPQERKRRLWAQRQGNTFTVAPFVTGRKELKATQIAPERQTVKFKKKKWSYRH